jgi:hypothetical protein
VATLVTVGYFGWRQSKIWEYERDLLGWRLPVALMKSDQLTSLSITNDALTNLRWLPCSFREKVEEKSLKMNRAGSFDHLIRAQHYRWGYGKAKRLGGLEV